MLVLCVIGSPFFTVTATLATNGTRRMSLKYFLWSKESYLISVNRATLHPLTSDTHTHTRLSPLDTRLLHLLFVRSCCCPSHVHLSRVGQWV